MHVGAGRFLLWRVVLIAQGAERWALFTGALLHPFQPGRPPTAVQIIGLCVPFIGVAIQVAAFVIVGLGVAGRVENALDMPAVGQQEALVTTEQLGRAIHRSPGRDVIVNAGHIETVDRDLLQVYRCAANL